MFDLDGVLIDSFESWYETFNKTLVQFGMDEISSEEFKRKYWGPELRENLNGIGLGEDAVRYCCSQHINSIDEIRLFPDTIEVLDKIKNKSNIKIGLVTNTPGDDVYRILEHFDLEKYFDAIVTRDDVREGKPNREIVTRACIMLNSSPRDAILVGDTESDVLSGRSAGCTVVGLNVDGDVRIIRLKELCSLDLKITS